MNENKHGDAYKVEMLRRMLAHETNACEEHYGAQLAHPDVSIKHLTIDAGGIDALIRYYENHDTDLDGGAPEFELTKCELETAYRKREHQYRLADAEIQLSAFFGITAKQAWKTGKRHSGSSGAGSSPRSSAARSSATRSSSG